MKNQILTCALWLLVTAFALAERVSYLDLPDHSTSDIWAAGQMVHPIVCWGGTLRKPYRMDTNDHEWSLVLRRRWHKDLPLDAKWMSFEGFNAKHPSYIKMSPKTALLSAKKNGIPKCWVALFRVPDEVKTSGDYRLKLFRKLKLGLRRGYGKSTKFYVESKETKNYDRVDAPEPPSRKKRDFIKRMFGQK